MCSKARSEDSRNTVTLTPHLSGVYESKPRTWKQEGPKKWCEIVLSVSRSEPVLTVWSKPFRARQLGNCKFFCRETCVGAESWCHSTGTMWPTERKKRMYISIHATINKTLASYCASYVWHTVDDYLFRACSQENPIKFSWCSDFP